LGRPAIGSFEPVRGDTLFEIGSITKTFTSLAAAIQIERGQIRLDQPIQELPPAGVELPPAARQITADGQFG
jgi:CubicO group peptidase (beta-lactamase class C family)